MEEAKVVRWLKEVGDQVAMGEVILEVETDKAVLDVESDLTGTLTAILVLADETVPCGEPLATIE